MYLIHHYMLYIYMHVIDTRHCFFWRRYITAWYWNISFLKSLTKLSKSEVYSESSVREQAGANQGWCESPCLIWVNTHIDSDGIEANCLTMGMVVPWTGADIGAHSCWWDDHSLYTMVWPRHILLWKKNTDFLLLTFYHQFCCLNHHICPHHCITNQPKQRLITFCETYQFSYPRFAEQP